MPPLIVHGCKSLYHRLRLYLIWRPLLKIGYRINESIRFPYGRQKKNLRAITQQYCQSDGVNFCLEQCLFFASPTGTDGHLSLRGWVVNEKNGSKKGKPYDLKIVMNKRSKAAVNLHVDRPDVQSQLPHAPVRSGFDIQIPTRTMTECISIYSYRTFTDRFITHLAVYNADCLISTEGYRSLSSLKKKKLDNLLLNEKERLHKCITLKSRPLHLYIDPSFACNLKCPYCHGEKIRQTGYRLPLLSEAAMDKILESFGETLVQVYFANWGEPLLNKHFPKLVQKMKTYQIWVHTSSNLSLILSDSQIDDIITSGLDFLIVSVDGITQEIYQKYRKQGNLNLVLANIRRLVKRKRDLSSATPVLEWQMLEFPWNRHQINDAFKMAMEMGVDKFKCIPGDIHDSNVPSTNHRTDNGPAQMGAVHLKEMKILLQEKKTNLEYFGCDHLYRHLCIYPDGSTYPCYNVVEPSHSIGNIFKEDVENIVNGRYQINNRKLFERNLSEKIEGYEPCLHCELIVGKSQHRGHAFSTLDFPLAFKVITGENIHDFLKIQQPSVKIKTRPTLNIVPE